MEKNQIIENYKAQIAALGERYTFSRTMCDAYSSEFHSVSCNSLASMFELASQFCKFYQDCLDVQKQINAVTNEMEFIVKHYDK